MFLSAFVVVSGEKVNEVIIAPLWPEMEVNRIYGAFYSLRLKSVSMGSLI